MKPAGKSEIHPREVANKTSKEILYKAIDMALEVETEAIRLNTKTFNTNRYKAIAKLEDYDSLKDKARAIKEYSIQNMPELIEKVTASINKRGGKVFLAKTKNDATEYIKNVCKQHGAKLVVKSKSITSEEIGLNKVLEEEKIEVAETDLAEFILQVSKEQPSHIVAPAIHRSRERISKLFKEHFDTDKPLETGEELTEFARDILRQKFLKADIGISGANIIAADEGTILLVESEGNIRLTTQLPAVHIAVAGIEKIIPGKKDLGTFIELLAASGTGQSLTSYTNILEPPLNMPIFNLNGRQDTEREFHLVLIDNGRMNMCDDDELREALYCIRCSACMNSCANFQTVGGHAFGGECYTGGIGGAWTVGTTGNIEEGRFAELCTGCSRCVPNCPVRIDIPHLNTVIKQRLIKHDGGASLQKLFFGNYSVLAKIEAITPGLANWVSNLNINRKILEKTVGFDKHRKIPNVPAKTLVKQFSEYRKYNKSALKKDTGLPETILLADLFTNYNNPHIGIATLEVFDKLGIPISLSKVMDDGRALQSQGLLEKATEKSIETSKYLFGLINEGKDVIVSEPSVLSIFRYDYQKLIENNEIFSALKEHTFDPIEYIEKLIRENKIDLTYHLKTNEKPRLFYHGHCQMKTVNAGYVAYNFFKNLGFNISVSTVECCGMAGSFGYKKEFFELSKNIGNDLIQQITNSDSYDVETIILASGTSCREQIGAELKNTIIHPVEFLKKILK